jgi:succinate dehydrogenase/fumarate reductase flavoprotein subunit
MQNPDPKTGIMLDPTCIAIDDTIAGLAAKMGVNAANLQATITRYNGFVGTGVDADFGKPSPQGTILTGPFYGAKLSLIRHTQRNGLRVNSKMQVIEADQGTASHGVSIDQLTAIPHLYAAGEDGDILGYRRGHNTLAHYVSAARICGTNAALGTPAATNTLKKS